MSIPQIPMQPRILIVRLSALGDILHGLPVLAALRRELPESVIGWVVEDRGAALLEGHPMLNHVHVVPRGALRENPIAALTGPVRELVGEIREQDYQTSIDLQGLTKSAWWGTVAGAKRRIGFRGDDSREVSRFFYNEPVSPRADQFHVVQRNLALLRPLGVESDLVEFPVHLPDEAKANAKVLWGEPESEEEATPSHPRVVMNPGAGWKTKQWPAARYGELATILARDLRARVALAWGPGEEDLVDAALQAAGAQPMKGKSAPPGIPTEPGVYALPPTSFIELGAVIEGTDLFVAGDTGPTHFAAALGVPTVSVFGASDAARNRPWGDHCETIQLDAPSCIPCWQTRCDWNEPLACLTQISVETVKEECFKLLSAQDSN